MGEGEPVPLVRGDGGGGGRKELARGVEISLAHGESDDSDDALDNDEEEGSYIIKNKKFHAKWCIIVIYTVDIIPV